MNPYVLEFQEIQPTHLRLVGGKGYHLGELSKIQGIHVPEGFCVTTAAFEKALASNETFHMLLDRITRLKDEDLEQTGEISGKIRKVIMQSTLPQEMVNEVDRLLEKFGREEAYAVRSSATAEDSPDHSFAGQLVSWLHVKGTREIFRSVKQCWASLFTDRAVIYRMKNGRDHREVLPAVVIQRMVFPDASGVMFTADPVTSNRKVLAVDACFGLGEALVSGEISGDSYKVREGKITEKRIACKKSAVYARKEGGTEKKGIPPEKQNRPVLSEKQVLKLEQTGRMLEAHFGCPQDIEWCLADGTVYIVQSRPVTTLFPVPKQGEARGKRVYVSVGHQQMMTDAMKPLGLSFFLLTTPAPMRTAGGRLFVDVTPMLASPESRNHLIQSLGQNDPLIKDALMTIVKRENFFEDFTRSCPDSKGRNPGPGRQALPSPPDPASIPSDPSVVLERMRKAQASVEQCKQEIRQKAGPALFDYIRHDLKRLRKELSSHIDLIQAAMDAAMWINEKMEQWLGEKHAADQLTQSVPNNITSEMGMELLEVADAIRPYPQVVDYLQQVKKDSFLDDMIRLEGGKEARAKIDAFLEKHGMRCPGEIDITRTRWSEKPVTLVPVILHHVKNFGPGAGRRKFEQGKQKALKKEKELLERLKELPDGGQKARETKRMIQRLRNLAGFREYPKYCIIQRYFIYKQSLLKEAEKLVQKGILRDKEEVFYLTFDEFCEAVRTGRLDKRIIRRRKREYQFYEKLFPPRVITSDGEIIQGRYRRENLPDNAILGLPVSSGIVEGRARVLLNMEDAVPEDGGILVTRFTDPGWTPFFVSVKGLVTEVGGLMTHGAVIAREYGLPAVVGVENATKRIKDGQRIRVNGTEGYIEILE
ncbi:MULTISPECIES: phosphoenolpyruvate synthase [Thermoactinomyces]|jgi:rifampicin phosphotransferase|uniref:phosphoenolpyruvate synthase n=1 Tax=Thermoactinomyces TaxID=2023 RepID=UPI000508570C|nr:MULTISPECIES: phosphoenolpyruvate synthase [Thermoactinomyces]KFZ40420.1 phosphoenolpyruvate synthase [Thermoactinomyces sp. Gus2-1]QCV54853.1 phosphoenolpyruvate synthase [Thermoactinomyces vulgaris]